MKPMDVSLEQKLRGDPNAHVRLIIRTAAKPAQYRTALEQQGLRVLRVSTLINAVTVEGLAKSALALRDKDWVAAIEDDRPVHSM